MPIRYVRKVLQPGETIVYSTKLHWIIYWKAIFLSIICIILAVSAWYTADNQNLSLALVIAAIIFALLALSSAFVKFIKRWTTELAVTDRRVIYKERLIARRTLEMNRSRVESVDVYQSVLGRLLGYGTITLRGTGGSGEPMPNIDDPLTFRSYITAS
ncbi:MAG TPA: PH domain-containing protein [Stellaceae bacterium]|nr:PH domain-containing protein [Stellaceae bacterium]